MSPFSGARGDAFGRVTRGLVRVWEERLVWPGSWDTVRFPLPYFASYVANVCGVVFEILGGAFCRRLVGPGVSFHCVFVFVKLIVLVSLFVGWLYLLRCVVTGYRGGVTSLLSFHRQISGVVGSRRGNMCCSST